jgi:DNA-binding MarR family transcriptional regulator
VSDTVQADGEEATVRWLTAEELESWLSAVRLMILLPWSIDQQLQSDSNLAMIEYQVLAMLTNNSQRVMRMSSLAKFTNSSLSRLSRVVKRLEDRGFVRRERDPVDGRFTNAILTDAGFRTLEHAAPGHISHIRTLVIDNLSPKQLRELGSAAERILSRIEPSPFT